jgi:hypothetical protein
LAGRANRRSLEAEERAWKELLSPAPATTEAESPEINPDLLSPSQRALLALIADPSPSSKVDAPQPPSSSPLAADPLLARTTPAALTLRLRACTSALEPAVDALADGAHRLARYADAAARVAGGVKRAWAARLERRDRDARREAGAEDVGGRDVLRALAGELSGR